MQVYTMLPEALKVSPGLRTAPCACPNSGLVTLKVPACSVSSQVAMQGACDILLIHTKMLQQPRVKQKYMQKTFYGKADITGVGKEDVKLTVIDTVLTISIQDGSHNIDKLESSEDMHYMCMETSLHSAPPSLRTPDTATLEPSQHTQQQPFW